MTRKIKTFFRIDAEDKALVLEAAERRGANFSEAIRESLALYAGLSDDFRVMVYKFSDAFDVPASVILENLALDSLARKKAEDAIKGKSPVELFPKNLDGEPITGDEFLRMREAAWAGRYRK